MACTPAYHQTLVHWEHVGYHRTEMLAVPHIMSEGLVPWDENGMGPQDDTELCPRPGHVYLGLQDFNLLGGELRIEDDSKEGDVSPYYAVLAVDIATLDPSLINPDEDSYWEHGEGWDSKHQHCTHTPVNPYTYDDLEVEAEGSYDSFGAWAEGIGLGDDPEHTECGIRSHRTLAYNGAIKPEHITLHECFVARDDDGTLYWDHRPATVSADELAGRWKTLSAEHA